MSYIPLHHKYRPQTFAQLVGQEAIATTLSNALTQKRIAPAYLFTGARGTGKTSSARILAKSLNCIAGSEPTPHPCGQCETCREITQGSALDVIEIDAASNTGVDNIRELIERAQFAPVRCRYKVYVIDEVHMLSNAAFNALLKTLEEPPERVVFVLATTDPQRVLPTIISRCQRFDFRRIPLEAMVQHLGQIAQQEQIAIAPDAVQLVAQISQGGMRDAESLLDQLSLLAGEVTVEKVWDLVGAVPERDLMALVQAIATDDPETMLDHTRRLMDRGREPLIVLQNLASFYRDLLIAKTAPQRNDLVAITPPTWAEMTAFVQSVDIGWLLAGQQHLRSAEVQIKNTTQPRLWLEVTLMGLLPSAIATSSIATQTSAVQQGVRSVAPQPSAKTAPKPSPQPTAAPTPPRSTVAPTAVPPNTPTPEPPPAVSAIDPSPAPAPSAHQSAAHSDSSADSSASQPLTNPDLETLWQQILGHIDSAPALGMIRPNCQLLKFDGQEITIGVVKTMLAIVKKQSPALGKACAKACKANVKLVWVAVDGKLMSSPPGMPQDSGAPSQPRSPGFSAPSAPAIAPPPRSQPASPQAAPAPRIPSSAPVPADRTAPSSGTAPIGDLPSAAGTGYDLDELSRATKSLAEAFNGQVVNLEDEVEEPETQTPPDQISQDPRQSAPMPTVMPVMPTVTTPTVAEILAEDGESSEDDDDVPF
ncbi:DNA polymerase III subunit gamma/tau [Alkalinema sp. FACHB-956]|uniref:DNA polymerase III subunit gamma/tau n=1 Tax=Alkalinema sp. FACHB-956 TaxID=2692768 RepID=UPI0016863F87|nr:DNA polymerase III subunit gamma/tau [Alkalinema sp. FACHB-956]MBD2327187.1 DNA polymerase III subunit gamma/tau [Alkalinema sp. FACHB-956]